MTDNSSTSQTTGEKSLIELMLTSANDSARHFRGVYTVYLTVMLYAIVVALSINQELIFREGFQQLPLVNINVPVVAFFAVIPWFLLVIHFYLLIQATFLSDKVRLYVSELEKSQWHEEADKARKLLFPLPLAHIVSEKGSQFKATWILSLIVFISLIVYPLTVLIGIQIRFLPYQNELITWAHRIVITIDILLLWYFWLRIFFPENKNSGEEKMRKRLNVSRSFAVSLIFIVLFIVVFADFPSDNKSYYSYTSKFHEWLNVEWIKRIELDGYTLVEKEPLPEILTAHYMKDENNNENLITRGSHLWCKYAEPLDLSGRNFREAQLSSVTLCDANLFGADLSGANLWKAKLYEADLSRAILSEADLSRAILSETTLTNANLVFANFSDADLFRANLSHAKITDADIPNADLSGADFSLAIFSRAILRKTNIEYFWVRDGDLPIDIPKSWVKLGYVCPWGINIWNYSGEERKEIIEKHCKPYKSQDNP